MAEAAAEQIAIVGGGPGGLTLARLLQLQGRSVTVYERDADRDARISGSALDLDREQGLAALKEAGLMDGFWSRVRFDLDRLRLADSHGVVLYDFDRGVGSGVERPEIERTPLRQLLLDSLAPGTVRWNKKFDSAALAGDKVELRFADGECSTFDLAVGADGANSRLRPLVTPSRPAYAGMTLVEGLVPSGAELAPHVWQLLGGSAMMALGAEQTLGMATKSDGSLLFYAGMKAPPEAAREQLQQAGSPAERLGWFHAWFPQWDAIWEPLFLHTEHLIWRPQQVCPPDQHWDAHAAVTLLGDAAHVMPPYAGAGVNLAMLDALVLSRALARHADRQEAIAAYEEEMFKRTAGFSARTMANAERFFAPDAASAVVTLFKNFAQQAAASAAPAPVLQD